MLKIKKTKVDHDPRDTAGCSKHRSLSFHIGVFKLLPDETKDMDLFWPWLFSIFIAHRGSRKLKLY